MKEHFYNLSAVRNNGQDYSFDSLRGKVVLIVNTASKCGFTPQYKGLEELYRQYGAQGLVILGFPCDQFAHQEPGTDEEIAQFCEINFGVTFPLMARVDVNGKAAHPVFQFLKSNSRSLLGSAIKWNFTKFLVSADGTHVKRYAPATPPLKLKGAIEKELAAVGVS